jgi:hypothetical protein
MFFHVFIAIIEGFNINLVFHFLFGSLFTNHLQTSNLGHFFQTYQGVVTLQNWIDHYKGMSS